MRRLKHRLSTIILLLGLPFFLHGLLPKGDPIKPFSLMGIDDVTYTVTVQEERLTLITEKDGTAEISHPDVLMLDFWATWCAPCRAAMPHMQELFDKYKPEQNMGGMMLLGIALDRRGGRAVKRFCRNLNITYPMLAGRSRRKGDLIKTCQGMKSAYDIQGIPAVYIIDSRGLIRYVYTGFNPRRIPQIDQQIQTLVKGGRP